MICLCDSNQTSHSTPIRHRDHERHQKMKCVHSSCFSVVDVLTHVRISCTFGSLRPSERCRRSTDFSRMLLSSSFSFDLRVLLDHSKRPGALHGPDVAAMVLCGATKRRKFGEQGTPKQHGFLLFVALQSKAGNLSCFCTPPRNVKKALTPPRSSGRRPRFARTQ